MYGRNLVFLDAYYVIVESVKKKTWDPITTVIIDIHRGKYASLNHWYTDILVEDEVVLKNRYEKSTLILKGVDGLEWIQL
jgi:conserved domain protein